MSQGKDLVFSLYVDVKYIIMVLMVMIRKGDMLPMMMIMVIMMMIMMMI